jgi:hypothetical protein
MKEERAMVVVMKLSAGEAEVAAVRQRLEESGFRCILSKGRSAW